ncbi:MAG: molybdenum cofactor guanylyltransferase MobA [Bauldia sp.]|nr:MAG: molybdenum cofactor guanylyltransferase MobA [Bauldia sp.]
MSKTRQTDHPIVGVVLAGGRSRRMGTEKALILLGGRPLLAHVVERLGPQVDALVVNANGDPARFAAFGIPVVADPVPDFAGPLAGVLAGMLWARANLPAARLVATVATDTPFLPLDLVTRLVADSNGGRTIAIARSAGGLHRVIGVFPVTLAGDLNRFIKSPGSLKVADWLDRHEVGVVDFPTQPPIDPFLNINTPEDLAVAEAAATAR